MLPEAVWQIPSIGTFNLHASLLPQYRGAAPINWAIINGENKTGITTFLIDKEIDTGKVLFREEIAIGETDTAGALHDKLMVQGGALVVKTIEALCNGKVEPTLQHNLIDTNSALKPAPKLFKETCKINWENNSTSIFNLIRGLSPYPCAWSNLTLPDGTSTTAKIVRAQLLQLTSSGAGNVDVNGKNLSVSCGNGSVIITQIQPAGKKVMEAAEFLRGLRGTGNLNFW
jgi:methionyl-tRNA formyltransferase